MLNFFKLRPRLPCKNRDDGQFSIKLWGLIRFAAPWWTGNWVIFFCIHFRCTHRRLFIVPDAIWLLVQDWEWSSICCPITTSALQIQPGISPGDQKNALFVHPRMRIKLGWLSSDVLMPRTEGVVPCVEKMMIRNFCKLQPLSSMQDCRWSSVVHLILRFISAALAPSKAEFLEIFWVRNF